MELVGTITEVEIRNPHALITLDVVDSDGVTTEWLAEWSDGNALRRRAVDIDLIKEGEEVTINARRHRRLDHVIYIRDVVLSDGTMVRGLRRRHLSRRRILRDLRRGGSGPGAGRIPSIWCPDGAPAQGSAIRDSTDGVIF